MLRKWLLGLGAVAFALLLAEGIVRSLGRTSESRELPLRLTPANARLYLQDDELGYRIAPDVAMRIQPLDLPQAAEFSIRTDRQGRRWTNPRPDEDARKPEIWIFGCSFTFGWLVDDDQSYPWLLQQRLPSFAVRNYSTGGYGTLQSLLQFRRALRESDLPRIAILAYANFHDERNVMSLKRSKLLGESWRAWGEADQPYAHWLGGGRLEVRNASAYQPFVPWVRYSALANRLDLGIVKLLERRALREDHREDISRQLVLEFAEESRRHGVAFALAQLDPPLAMLEFARSRGIPAADLALPKQPEFEIADDGHPNPTGHRWLAERAQKLIAGLALPEPPVARE